MKHKSIFGIIIAASVLISGLAFTGCDDPPARQARRAAAGITSGLIAVQAENEKWFAAGKLSSQETIAIANGVSDATLVNDEFSAHIKAVEQIDPKNLGSLLGYTQTVVASLDRLNQQISSVHDPDVQGKLKLAFATIDAALNILRALIVDAKPFITQSGPTLVARSAEGNYGPNNDCSSRSRTAEHFREVDYRASLARTAHRRAA